MREMVLFMENTCKPYVKKLCMSYIVLVLTQCILAYVIGQGRNVYVYYLPSLVALCVVNRVHVKRVRKENLCLVKTSGRSIRTSHLILMQSLFDRKEVA